MIVVPPENKMEWAVYNELKTNEYWNQVVEKKKNDGSKQTELLYEYSEGEKAIIYDTFKEIDKLIHPNYDGINLHWYLIAIDKECNHTNTTWNMAMKRIIKKMFNVDIEDTTPQKI